MTNFCQSEVSYQGYNPSNQEIRSNGQGRFQQARVREYPLNISSLELCEIFSEHLKLQQSLKSDQKSQFSLSKIGEFLEDRVTSCCSYLMGSVVSCTRMYQSFGRVSSEGGHEIYFSDIVTLIFNESLAYLKGFFPDFPYASVAFENIKKRFKIFSEQDKKSESFSQKILVGILKVSQIALIIPALFFPSAACLLILLFMLQKSLQMQRD